MNYYFFAAGLLSATAAVLHLGCIYFGAPWYRFFGAGEQMATMAEQGSLQPTLITLGIFGVLTTWAAYAFSAARFIRPLPLMRFALPLITSVYLLRGIAGFALISAPMGRTSEFWIWSSVICLSIGLVHLLGLKTMWKQNSQIG